MNCVWETFRLSVFIEDINFRSCVTEACVEGCFSFTYILFSAVSACHEVDYPRAFTVYVCCYGEFLICLCAFKFVRSMNVTMQHTFTRFTGEESGGFRTAYVVP